MRWLGRNFNATSLSSILCFIHYAHATFAELGEDFVVGDCCTDHLSNLIFYIPDALDTFSLVIKHNLQYMTKILCTQLGLFCYTYLLQVFV